MRKSGLIARVAPTQNFFPRFLRQISFPVVYIFTHAYVCDHERKKLVHRIRYQSMLLANGIYAIMIKNTLKRTPFAVLAKAQRAKKNGVKYSLFMTVFPSSALGVQRSLNELTPAALSFAL